ncbi:hypothetical protein FIBSPDRAFT_828343 [Athelia psychrophila]|uniref:Uncharacterized protein n=1 Tax=Athelia psychrophila TaxID=1759441 RepID=A0A166I061_9AGAM|nr:hypothetical protein FIBSPDRAFT_828343 [Fibularhizoctonia sp. CBS 109695]
MANKRSRSGSAESISAEPPRKEQRKDEDASDSTDGNALLSLAQLVDFSALASEAAITRQSQLLAEALLWDHTLLLVHQGSHEEYEILELEFYLKKVGHEDPFAHGSEEQRVSGNWYFHRAPTRSAQPAKPSAAGGYRGGTRKGLDLTIAGPVATPKSEPPAEDTVDIRGGILLRTIRRLSDDTVISGPSLLVDELLRLTKSSNIAQLVQTRLRDDTSALPMPSSAPSDSPTTSLRLKPKVNVKGAPRPRIYRSSRIGLDLSNPSATNSPTNPRVIFISKLYRYFTRPHLLTSNGKGHTFHGLYQASAEEYEDQEDIMAEVVRLSGMKQQTALKYLGDYKAGLDKSNLKSFIGPAGKGAAGSPSSYLKMMGTLDRLASDIASGSSKEILQ